MPMMILETGSNGPCWIGNINVKGAMVQDQPTWMSKSANCSRVEDVMTPRDELSQLGDIFASASRFYSELKGR